AQPRLRRYELTSVYFSTILATSRGQDMLDGDLLIVDDNIDNLSVLTGMLREAGYRVRTTTRGDRALAMSAAHAPELILLDIQMPELDGYEVCRRLKQDEALRAIPIIFISALDSVFDKVKAFKAGGVDYVTKPFEVEEV